MYSVYYWKNNKYVFDGNFNFFKQAEKRRNKLYKQGIKIVDIHNKDY